MDRWKDVDAVEEEERRDSAKLPFVSRPVSAIASPKFVSRISFSDFMLSLTWSIRYPLSAHRNHRAVHWRLLAVLPSVADTPSKISSHSVVWRGSELITVRRLSPATRSGAYRRAASVAVLGCEQDHLNCGVKVSVCRKPAAVSKFRLRSKLPIDLLLPRRSASEKFWPRHTSRHPFKPTSFDGAHTTSTFFIPDSIHRIP